MNDDKRIWEERTFERYKERIVGMRQAVIDGETIVAKPVLLLALIDMVESGEVKENRFWLSVALEEKYYQLMTQHRKHSQFPNPTDIANPFWHLESDGFWHIKYLGEHRKKGYTPSKAWLKDNVKFASLDEDLWILLQSKEWRTKLREYIIEHKLTIKSQ